MLQMPPQVKYEAISLIKPSGPGNQVQLIMKLMSL